MRKRLPISLILGLSLVGAGLMACGDDSNGDAADDEVGDGDGDGDGDEDPTGDGDGDDPTGDGDGDDPTGDGDGDDPTTGDGDGDPSDCMVWEITYDLTGSEFEIGGTFSGLGDQVNKLEEPYENDDTVGPGTFVLHFQDADGAPGTQAFMHAYEMSMHFTVSSLGVTVKTDLENEAGPVDCGITSGA
ncbi:MAG: hypothetical protein R6X02_04800, partial [Enhygromyxa sp.]